MKEHSFVMETPIVVPANSSRFFATRRQSQAQPEAEVRLAWDAADPFLYNPLFEAGKIAHDAAYYTGSSTMAGTADLPTLDYFFSLPADLDGRVVDIGCGRGEFVGALRAAGLDAVGYDPVLPEATDHLHPRYWQAGNERGAAVFVMRCVLPHVPDPWQWVRTMGRAHPGALLLVEFQRREWILGEGVWQQLSHDHVNVFSAKDFEARFEVLAHDTFREDEWAWVLFRPDTYRRPDPQPPGDVATSLRRLELERARFLADISGPVALWGAAGKGIVLAHALTGAGKDVAFAVDADPGRHGRFMEVCGTPITSPASLADLAPISILVSNPHHLPAVRAHLSGLADGWDARAINEGRRR